MFYTVMKVKGKYYLYKVVYLNGKKKFIYIGPCEKLEEWARGDSNPGPPPRKGGVLTRLDDGPNQQKHKTKPNKS